MQRCRKSHGLCDTQPLTTPENWTVHPEALLQEEMETFFVKKIAPLIPHSDQYKLVFQFAFHGNFSGYGIHTDAGYDPEEIIYQQGIIPLKINPEGSSVHTVIMNQQCYHSSSFPCVSEDLSLQEHVDGLDFENCETKSQFSKYWEGSLFRKKQINGFSIQFPFQWKLGDSVIWNRSYIHCSSDFSVSETYYKEGLMWISKLIPKA